MLYIHQLTYECTAAALPKCPYSLPLTDITNDMDEYSLPDSPIPPLGSCRIIHTTYDRGLPQNKISVAQCSCEMNEKWTENQRDVVKQGVVVTNIDDLADKVSLAYIFIRFY